MYPSSVLDKREGIDEAALRLGLFDLSPRGSVREKNPISFGIFLNRSTIEDEPEAGRMLLDNEDTLLARRKTVEGIELSLPDTNACALMPIKLEEFGEGGC